MSDLEVSFPKEGTGYEVGGVAVVKGAPNPDAARLSANRALAQKRKAAKAAKAAAEVSDK